MNRNAVDFSGDAGGARQFRRQPTLTCFKAQFLAEPQCIAAQEGAGSTRSCDINEFAGFAAWPKRRNC